MTIKTYHMIPELAGFHRDLGQDVGKGMQVTVDLKLAQWI